MLSRTFRAIRDFCSDESGAVTVDWVVMTAAVVGLALSALVVIQRMAADPSESLGAFIGNVEINNSF